MRATSIRLMFGTISEVRAALWLVGACGSLWDRRFACQRPSAARRPVWVGVPTLRGWSDTDLPAGVGTSAVPWRDPHIALSRRCRERILQGTFLPGGQMFGLLAGGETVVSAGNQPVR